MKSSSIQRFSMRCLSTPLMNAMSPPVWIVKNSSANRVPNSALPGTEGTQYRSSPGSRRGLQRVVPGDPTESALPSMADHRVRQPAEFPKVPRGLRSQHFDVLQMPDAQRPHRVQREEVESNGAEMDPLHREVAKAGGPEGAPITDAVPEDPPSEDGPVLVVPRGPQDLAVIVRLR